MENFMRKLIEHKLIQDTLKENCNKTRKEKLFKKSKCPKTDMQNYENERYIKCPICFKTLLNRNLRSHFYEHGLNNYQIIDFMKNKHIQIKCPYCSIFLANKIEFKKHLRKEHPEKLSRIALGAYHTETTIEKMKQYEKDKTIEKEIRRFEQRFVSGGLPSLGKKSK